jgi:hypothetical protein
VVGAGQKYGAGTINTQMSRAERVAQCHGNLDEHYANDRMASLIEVLRYSAEDARRNRPNPSKIPIDGNLRNNLASYCDAVRRYQEFRDTDDGSDVVTEVIRNDEEETMLLRLKTPQVEVALLPDASVCTKRFHRVIFRP